MPDFQIVTRGLPARAEEWLLAQRIPECDLPPLAELDKQRARIRHITDEQYSRRLFMRDRARKRETEEAKLLGGIVQDLFVELGGSFTLKGVVKRGFEPGWRVLIEFHAPNAGWKFFDISIPTEDFSGEPGKQVLNVSNHEEIRAFLLAELNTGEGQRLAS